LARLGECAKKWAHLPSAGERTTLPGMNLRRMLSLFCIVGAVGTASAQAPKAAEPGTAQPAQKETARPVFGPYEAIVFDHDVLQAVKVDADGNIFLMFKPERRQAQVRIRISMREGAEYRKWFNGEDELVALENAGREPNTWTDRVQTSANYIEYRDGTHLILQLKKTNS
jgi:hypothetical protein